MKTGYRTTEHALAWAVTLIAVVAVARHRSSAEAALDRPAALLASAIASAAYSRSRADAKRASSDDLKDQLLSALSELFAGRWK